MWLMAQLFDLGEFCGCRDKMDAAQAQECARIIKKEFGYLKVSEVMLFFHRCKSGRYGQIFYGSVDPMKITLAMRQHFLPEREREIVRKESEMRKKEEEEHAKTAISLKEYCREKGYPEFENMMQVIDYELEKQ